MDEELMVAVLGFGPTDLFFWGKRMLTCVTVFGLEKHFGVPTGSSC